MIIGNPVHPEVIGIMGWSSTPVTVIQTAEEALCFAKEHDGAQQEICVVAQTTFNANKFQDLVEILKEK